MAVSIRYSPAADAYNKVRPRYPKEIIDRVVELAKLSSDATILEVGCGPGNATVAFARVGFSMVCLELESGGWIGFVKWVRRAAVALPALRLQRSPAATKQCGQVND